MIPDVRPYDPDKRYEYDSPDKTNSYLYTEFDDEWPVPKELQYELTNNIYPHVSIYDYKASEYKIVPYHFVRLYMGNRDTLQKVSGNGEGILYVYEARSIKEVELKNFATVFFIRCIFDKSLHVHMESKSRFVAVECKFPAMPIFDNCQDSQIEIHKSEGLWYIQYSERMTCIYKDNTFLMCPIWWFEKCKGFTAYFMNNGKIKSGKPFCHGCGNMKIYFFSGQFQDATIFKSCNNCMITGIDTWFQGRMSQESQKVTILLNNSRQTGDGIIDSQEVILKARSSSLQFNPFFVKSSQKLLVVFDKCQVQSQDPFTESVSEVRFLIKNSTVQASPGKCELQKGSFDAYQSQIQLKKVQWDTIDSTFYKVQTQVQEKWQHKTGIVKHEYHTYKCPETVFEKLNFTAIQSKYDTKVSSNCSIFKSEDCQWKEVSITKNKRNKIVHSTFTDLSIEHSGFTDISLSDMSSLSIKCTRYDLSHCNASSKVLKPLGFGVGVYPDGDADGYGHELEDGMKFWKVLVVVDWIVTKRLDVLNYIKTMFAWFKRWKSKYCDCDKHNKPPDVKNPDDFRGALE